MPLPAAPPLSPLPVAQQVVGTVAGEAGTGFAQLWECCATRVARWWTGDAGEVGRAGLNLSLTLLVCVF